MYFNKFKSIFNILALIGLLFSSLCYAAIPSAYEDALKSFHQNNFDETIIHLKNALKDNIDHIPSRILLAKTLIAQGKGQMAETEIDDLQAAGVDISQLVSLKAQAWLLQNKYDRVISDITPGYRGNTIESEIQLHLGRAYLAKNQLRNAESAFITALDLAPDMQLANLGRAQVAINRNQLTQAMAFVDKALTAYEPLVSAWVMKGKIARLQGNYSLALTAIENALQIRADHMEARLNRASIYIAQNKPTLATPDVDYILNKIPEEPRAKYLKAVIQASEGDNKGSAKKLAEVIDTLNAINDEVMENNPSYFYLAGLTNFQFGNINEAKHFLQRYLSIKENDLNAQRLLAMVELRLENPSQANTILKKANIYFPNTPEILSLLGLTSMELKDYPTAQYYFEQVIKLQPKQQAKAVQNLARSQMATGNYQEAINQLLRLENKNNEDEVTLLLIESYLKSKQYKKAQALILPLIEQYPQNAYLAKKYAIILGLNGNNKSAREYLNKAIELNNNDIEAQIHLARMDVIEGNSKQALTKLTSLLEKNKDSLQLFHEIAGIHQKLGDLQQAHAWYEKAFARHAQNQAALAPLISSFIKLQQPTKAITVLQDFINKNKDVDEARLILGQLFLSTNQPQKAIKITQRLIKSDLDKARVYIQLANAHLAVGDLDAASLALTKAVAWDNSRISAMEKLFKLSLTLNDLDTAQRMIAEIGKQLPKQPLADNLAGDLAIHSGDFKQAVKHYQRAYQLNANQKSALGLYTALAKQKRYYLARTKVRTWLKQQPNDVIADIAIAESFVNENNINEAIKTYEQLLAKYQRMPILLNNLANLYHQQGDIKQALPLAEEAYKKAPNNVNVIDTLAWLTLNAGDSAKALPLFRQALALDFKNPEIKYHLAVTLDQEQRRPEAKKLLIEALQSDIDFADKDKAKQLLDLWLAQR